MVRWWGYSGVELTPGNVDAGVRELDRTRTGMKEGWDGRDDIEEYL